MITDRPRSRCFTRVASASIATIPAKKTFKIFESAVIDTETQDTPGKILQVNTEGIKVATGKGYLLLTEIQLQDRKRMKVTEFIKGNPLPIGTTFT